MSSHQWSADFTLDLNGVIDAPHPELFTFVIHFINAEGATTVFENDITEFDLRSEAVDERDGSLKAQFLGNGKFKISGSGYLFSSAGNSVTPTGTSFVISRIVINTGTQTVVFALGRDFDRNRYPYLLFTGLDDPNSAKFVHITTPGLVVDNVKTYRA